MKNLNINRGYSIHQWDKVMRRLRDKGYTVADVLDLAVERNIVGVDSKDASLDLSEISLYDVLMETIGQLPEDTWAPRKE